MREIRFAYTFQDIKTGEIGRTIKRLEDEGPYLDYPSNRWKLIGRDQFINFKDKSNNDIYEGDILRWLSIDGYVVKYFDACFGIEHYKIKSFHPLYTFKDKSAFEIIGNIYQNPKLLVVERKKE